VQGHTGKPAGRVIDVGRGRQGYRNVHEPTVTPRLRHEQGHLLVQVKKSYGMILL
jgi:hypothetical protein